MFSYTKYRTVSVRQLSFFLSHVSTAQQCWADVRYWCRNSVRPSVTLRVETA